MNFNTEVYTSASWRIHFTWWFSRKIRFGCRNGCVDRGIESLMQSRDENKSSVSSSFRLTGQSPSYYGNLCDCICLYNCIGRDLIKKKSFYGFQRDGAILVRNLYCLVAWIHFFLPETAGKTNIKALYSFTPSLKLHISPFKDFSLFLRSVWSIHHPHRALKRLKCPKRNLSIWQWIDLVIAKWTHLLSLKMSLVLKSAWNTQTHFFLYLLILKTI